MGTSVKIKHAKGRDQRSAKIEPCENFLLYVKGYFAPNSIAITAPTVNCYRDIHVQYSRKLWQGF